MIALAAERTSFPETAASYTLSGGTLFRYLVGPMRRDVAAIHCPTLILHGRRDRLVPIGFARALARRRRDWPLVELDGCGHVPQLEQPDRFVSTVDGLARPGARDLQPSLGAALLGVSGAATGSPSIVISWTSSWHVAVHGELEPAEPAARW